MHLNELSTGACIDCTKQKTKSRTHLSRNAALDIKTTYTQLISLNGRFTLSMSDIGQNLPDSMVVIPQSTTTSVHPQPAMEMMDVQEHGQSSRQRQSFHDLCGIGAWSERYFESSEGGDSFVLSTKRVHL